MITGAAPESDGVVINNCIDVVSPPSISGSAGTP